MHTIDIQGKDIIIDGKSTQIRSGAMHYFRIHPKYWEDRLTKLKQCGLNCVETYLAWNFHEPVQGQFDFTGWRDVAAFVRLARRLGLMVIVRPGPFICSEWDFGGIPAWVLEYPDLPVRSSDPRWLELCDNYLHNALSKLVDLQWTHGGPIIMMQVENEYGGVACDFPYLEHLYDTFRDEGIDVPLFISDYWDPATLVSGSIPETLLTINGRNHPERGFDVVQKLRPGVPDINMELWDGVSHKWTQSGWLTHDPQDVKRDIDTLMERHANFNLYMFHGGTTFGYNTGAVVENNKFLPYVNSYDTNAPLDEAGNPTPKYFLIQESIHSHCPDAVCEAPTSRPAVEYSPVPLTESALLFDSLMELCEFCDDVVPHTMEHYGQSSGFILYSTDLSYLPKKTCKLTFLNLADRAQIFVDGIPQGTIYREDEKQDITVPTGKLQILVESLGHFNSCYPVFRAATVGKGLTGVFVDGRRQSNWEICLLPMDNLSDVTFAEFQAPADEPAFHRGFLTVDKPQDTWLQVPTGHKGTVWLNGFNLGRYWEVGPQYALYVPAPLLKRGRNEIIVFEQHGFTNVPLVTFADHPVRADEIPLPLPQ